MAGLDEPVEPASQLAGEGQHGAQRPMVEGDASKGARRICLRIAFLTRGLAGHQLPPRGFEGAVGAARPIERIEFGHIVG